MRSWRTLGMFGVAFATILMVLIGSYFRGGDTNSGTPAPEKDEETRRIETIMNQQAEADRLAAQQTPKNQSIDKTESKDDLIERNIAINLGKIRVSESTDQILAICDESILYINKLPGIKKMSRIEFLFKANEMMALSDEEPIVSQKFKKDKNGKYRFRDAANAVKTVALAASKL